MTSVPSAPPRETYAAGLLQAFDAMLALADLGNDFSERAAVHASFTVHVHSEAEVDAAAAILGTTAGRRGPWDYRAVRCNGNVTVTVAFTSDPAAPASLAALESIARSASCDLPRGAA